VCVCCRRYRRYTRKLHVACMSQCVFATRNCNTHCNTRNCNTHCSSVCCTTTRTATVCAAVHVAVARGMRVAVCVAVRAAVCCRRYLRHPQQLRRHIPKDRKKEKKRKERKQCNTLQHETTATNCNKEVIDNVSMTAVCCSCSVLQCCLSPHPNQLPCVPCSAGFTSLLQCVAVLACCSALQCCLSLFPWGCVLVAMRCRACLLQRVAVHRAGWTARVLQCLLVAVSCSAVFFCLFGVLQSITLSLLLVDLAQGRKHCNCNSLQLQHTATCNTLK